jgi:hypothetical protein
MSFRLPLLFAVGQSKKTRPDRVLRVNDDEPHFTQLSHVSLPDFVVTLQIKRFVPGRSPQFFRPYRTQGDQLRQMADWRTFSSFWS